MNKKRILLTAAMLALLFGCSKKLKTVYITDPELLKAGNIREGSYFIFRDSTTGILDSYYVSYFNRYFKQPDESLGIVQPDEEYETIQYSISRDNNIVVSCQTGYYATFTYVFPRPGWSPLPPLRVLRVPFTITEDIRHGYNQVNVAWHDELWINGIKRKNVYETQGLQIDSLAGTAAETLRMFYSPDEGLVKFCYTSYDSVYKVLELERSKIIR